MPTIIERAEHFSRLAEECDQIAQIQSDPTLKAHYERIASHYLALAEAALQLAEERRARISKRTIRRKDLMATQRTGCSWRVSIVRKKPEYLGTIEAPNIDAAIKKAIIEFEVMDREDQRRLVALPILE